MDQKGLQLYEKMQTMEDTSFLAEFSLAELGGTPLPH